VDLSTPAASVISPLRASVLSVLANADAGLTGRRVAALSSYSVAGVAKVLESLVRGGLVHRVEAGSASLYSLNREHVGAPAVEALAGMRSLLISRLREAIDRFGQPPLCAVLFGSLARGDGDEDSDIDVLLIREDFVDEDEGVWADSVHNLESQVFAWTGNSLSVVQYSSQELAAAGPRRRAFLSEVQRDGLPLYGRDLGRLRRRMRAAQA
jgi:predicted nucleotidyltransferase